MCSIIFQVDSFIGIMQLVVPFSAWDPGQHIYLDFSVLLTFFSNKTTGKDYHSKNHILQYYWNYIFLILLNG